MCHMLGMVWWDLPVWSPCPCLLGKVVFNDTFGGAELSAVQVDQESSYKAEDTSFLGFYGEVSTLVFSFYFL